MFKKQIEELTRLEKDLSNEIEIMEMSIRAKRVEQRDVKAGISSLTRLQDKYDSNNKEEVEENETVSVSI